MAVSIWLLAARVGLAIFSDDASPTRWVLPAAFVGLNLALICEFAAYWIAYAQRRPAGEPYALLKPTMILIGLTAAWMILAVLGR